MAHRPHGNVKIDAKSPRAGGVCDRCGRWFSLRALNFQYDWRGNQIQNIKLRVCCECYDKPYEGRRPLKLPPDPLPVRDPRPYQNSLAEQNVPPQVLWDEPGILWDDGTTEFGP